MTRLREDINGFSWRHHPNVCRSDQELLISGIPTGVWIEAQQHPTALRPYCIVMGDGRILERKYSRLEDAKPAAIAALLADLAEAWGSA
ncbi:hypothetical protein [Bradyrhizobium sp. ORS 86]|uniref:hypothetical protein n=1 Tax=Bradyrhizobium sp. ORS 86 TaxID=1685970 RepID=UPI00388FE1B4